MPAPGSVPSSYHVAYRVTAGGVTTAEELWVQRPFESEDATSTAAGAAVSTVVYRLGRQLLHDAGATPAVFEPPPGPPPFDVRIDAVLQDALRSGRLVPEGSRVVAGRPCRVFRSATSLESTALEGRPTSADHVDSCVNSGGLVLDERRVSGGRTVLERRALVVSEGTKHSFVTAGPHIGLDEGGGKVVTITSDSRPPAAAFWVLPRPPAGFAELGRFAVVPPQAPAGPGASVAGLVTAVDDVFTRGPDVIVVEQGGTLDGEPLQPPVGSIEVALGRLGHGTLTLSAVASSVTAVLGRSAYVRLSGTVPPAALLTVARALQAEPGGTIVTARDLTSDGR